MDRVVERVVQRVIERVDGEDGRQGWLEKVD